MRALSLFSGIGGIDLACEWAGIETIAFCEREPFCQKVLAKHWPNVPIYDDVCTLTKERLEQDGIRTIELIHGGYPCQPFSLAGQREGTEDDRHLWPEVFRLIQAIKPRWFVGENVAGHITLGLDTVLSDLDSIGYSWEAFVLPAVAVNARHRRDRVFIVAYSNSIGNNGEGECQIDRNRQEEMQKRFESFLGLSNESENVAYSKSFGCDTRRPEPARQQGELCTTRSSSSSALIQNVTDSTSTGLQKRRQTGFSTGFKETGTRMESESKRYRSGQEWWAVEPAVGRVANGIPHRVDRLKALGNAVVPQQIYPILAAIKQIDDMLKENEYGQR